MLNRMKRIINGIANGFIRANVIISNGGGVWI